jgi:hypothetical protein
MDQISMLSPSSGIRRLLAKPSIEAENPPLIARQDSRCAGQTECLEMNPSKSSSQGLILYVSVSNEVTLSTITITVTYFGTLPPVG